MNKNQTCGNCKWDEMVFAKNSGPNYICAQCKLGHGNRDMWEAESKQYVYIVKYENPHIVDGVSLISDTITRYFSTPYYAEHFIEDLPKEVYDFNPCLNFEQVELDKIPQK